MERGILLCVSRADAQLELAPEATPALLPLSNATRSTSIQCRRCRTELDAERQWSMFLTRGIRANKSKTDDGSRLVIATSR
jgi:hypothetical protein